MGNETNYWQYNISNDTYSKVEIEDYLVKWTIDIIENPDVHFKAEDQRRFSTFTEHYQSFFLF